MLKIIRRPFVNNFDKGLNKRLNMIKSVGHNSIIIIDYSKEDCDLIQTVLGDSNNYFIADSCDEGLEMLKKYDDIRIIILDLTKHKNIGYDFINKVNDSYDKKVPIIVITNIEDKSTEKTAINLGVEDVILKPFNKTVLKKRINNIILRIVLSKEVEQKHLFEYKRLSEIDDKTQLYNRNTFYREVSKVLNENPQKNYVIARWDIDRFKVFNDAYGTVEGDKLLAALGARFIKKMEDPNVHGIAVYGYLGADHFASLWEAEYLHVEKFYNYLKTQVDEIIPYYSFRISIGLYRVEDRSLDVAIMCDRALLANRSIKKAYHSYYAWFDDSMRGELMEEQEILGDMHNALEKGQFVPYFQPQYDYGNGSLIGAEVLVRWQHPTKGIVLPDKFIPIFEKYGMINMLDRYIWEQSCILLREWIDAGMRIPHISVNVSRRDLYIPNFCNTFIELINKYHLPAYLFHLEITESAYMDNPDQLIQIVEDLQSHGLHVEMDDFGNGYSSLNTLKDVAVDTLKLDMKFISEDVNNNRGGSILSSVIRLANAIKLPVIAEGVETKEQAEYLKSIGCLYMQGFFFARPMSAEAFEKILKKGHCFEIINDKDKLGTDGAADFLSATTQSTLIFNSFIGGAGILEYANGVVTALRLNDEFFTILGTTRQQYADRQFHILDRFTSETREEYINMLDRAIQTGLDTDCEVCSVPIAQDALPVWTYNKVRCIAERFGSYIFFLSVENITERKNLEYHNASLNRQLSLIMKSSQAGIIRYCLKDGKIFTDFVSEGFCKLIGYDDVNEVSNKINSNILNYVYKDDIERLSVPMKNTIQYGSDFDEQYRLVCKDGSVIWVSMRGNFSGNIGVEGFFYATYLDISNLKNLELNLSSEKLKLEGIVDSIPGGVITMSVQPDKIESIFVSRGLAEIFGKTQEEFEYYFNNDQNNGIYMFDSKMVMDSIRYSVDSDKDIDINFRIEDKNKHLLWLHLRGHKIDVAGDYPVFCAVVSNLSEATELYQSIINKLESSIFVADINTLEVLYANEHAINLADIPLEKLKSHKCYEYIKHRNTPCDYCKVRNLSDKVTVIYDDYIGDDGRYYIYSITKIKWNGRDVFISNKVDRTDIYKVQIELENIIHNIPGGVVVFKCYKGNVKRIYLSESAYSILGYSEGEGWSEDMNDFLSRVHPDDLQRVKNGIEKSIANIEQFNMDVRSVAKDGSIIWTNLTANPYKMDDGIYFFGLYTNIDKRKQVEGNNKLLIENFNDILKNSSSGVYRCYLGSPIYIDYVSETYCKMVGYSQNELIDMINSGKRLIIYEKDLKYVLDCFEELARTPQIKLMEYRLRCKDGKIIYISNSARSMLNNDGKMVAYCTVVDVSEQKQNTELLQILAEEYSLVIEHANKTIYRYIIAEKRIEVPKKSLRIFGKSSFIINEETLLINAGYMRENTEKNLFDFFAQIDAGVPHVKTEICIHAFDKLDHWFLAESFIVNDKEGKAVSAIITIEDISKQHENKISQIVDKESFYAAMRRIYEMAFSVNLSDNEWSYLYNDKLFTFFEDSNHNYDSLIKYSLDIIDHNYYKVFVDTFSRESLLKSYSEGKNEVSLEYLQSGKDGYSHWIKTTAIFINSEVDNDVRLVCISQIIDQEKYYENELKDKLNITSDALARRLYYGDIINHFAPGLVAVLYLNDSYSPFLIGNLPKLIGYSNDEIIRFIFHDLNSIIYKDDIQTVIDNRENVINNYPDQYEIEYRIIKKDGDLCWISEKGLKFVDSENRSGYICIYLDGTVHHQLIEHLRVSEEETRLSIAKMGKIICRYDITNNILSLPKEYADLHNISETYHYEQSDIENDTIDNTYYLIKNIQPLLKSIINGDKNGSEEYSYLNENGAKCWETAEFVSIFDSNGKSVRAIITIDDTTSKHDATQKLSFERLAFSKALAVVYPMTIVVNLTQNTYYMLEYDNFSNKTADEQGVFDELIDVGVSTIPDDFKVPFRNAFSRQNLLSAFAEGKNVVRLEHKQWGDDGKVHWIETVVIHVDNTFDDDIYEFTICRNIDAQKEIECKLQQSLDFTSGKLIDQLRYVTLVNDALHGLIDVFYCDDIYLSIRIGKLLKDFGYDVANNRQILVNERNNFIYKDDYETIINKINVLMQSDKNKYEVEYRVKKTDGAFSWILEQGIRFTDDNGRCGYVVIYIDTTKSHALVDRIIVSEHEIQVCMESMGKMLCKIDIPTKTLYLPKSFAKQLGIPEVIPNIYETLKQYDIFGNNEEYDKHVVPFFNSIFRGDSRGTTLAYFRFVDGSFHWCKAEFVSFFDNIGKPLRALFTSEEITALKMQEEENIRLKKNENIFKIIEEHSSRIFYYYNAKENVAFAFDQDICKHYGLEATYKDPVKFMSENGIVYSDSIKSLKELFDKINHGETRGEIKVHIRGNDNIERWFDMRFSIIPNANEQMANAVLSFLNITEQHSREVAYARYQQSLRERNMNDFIFFEVDLTSDIIENQGGRLFPNAISLLGQSHTDSIPYVMNTYMVKSSRADALNYFSRNRLLSLFADGQYELTNDWQVIFHDGTLHWVNVSLQMVIDPYSNHVKANIIIKDITEYKERQLSVIEQAELDGMTQVYNRTTSERIINKYLLNYSEDSCVFLIVDLDDLKRINDTLGHVQGDRALRSIAIEMKKHFRRSDIIGRLGGDEFVAFIPGMKNDVTFHFSLSSLIRKISIIPIGEHNEQLLSCSVGATIGVIGFDTFESLYKQADIALYHVKRNGKNNYAFYESDMKLSNYKYINKYNKYAVSLKNNEFFDVHELRKLISALASFFPLIISVNLTKNTLYLMEYERYFNSDLPKTDTVDDFIQSVSMTIHQDDREMFLSYTTRVALLDIYASGKNNIYYDCRQLDDKGVYRWVRVIIMFYTIENGDICEFTIVRESPEKEQEFELRNLHKIIDKAVVLSFEYICLLHPKDGTFEIYGHEGHNTHTIPLKGNFDEITRSIMNNHIILEERETYYDNAIMEHVVERMQKTGRYHYKYTMEDGARQAEFYWCDESHQDILMTVRHIGHESV